ncbi:MAG: ABC transporter substrate-binding protein [Frankiaceae bacterium]|nr:ABC transporter substrate-binding protein [Frankiaceae bacterium]
MKQHRLAIVAALAGGLLLSACSTSDDIRTAPVSADSAATPGGTLRVGILRPTTIDPQLLPTGDTAAALVVRTMCDPLIGTDPVSRELSPAVAKDWRVLGPNGAAVVLRKDVHFSDGTPLTARDVAYSLTRILDPDVASPQNQLFSHIAGWQDVQDGKHDVSSLQSIKATTKDVVQVFLDKDDAQFIYALAQPFATPVPREAATKPGFSSHPICLGPYALEGQYTGVEDTITLVRVEDYPGLRPALSRSGRGWADRVVFTVFDGPAPLLSALQSGRLDAAQLGGTEGITAAATGITVTSVPTGRLEYVGLPNRDPLNNPVIQAALRASLDRERINNVAFHGTRTPAYNLIPPTMPDSVLPTGRIRDCQIDPTGHAAEAKQLIATAVPPGTSLGTLPFYFNDEFDNKAMVNELVKQWAPLGLKLQPTPVSFANLVARGEGSGGFDGVFRMTATAEYADQSAFVLPLVSVEALGKTNYTGYNGELLARLIRNRLEPAVPAADQRRESLAVTRATCAVPIIPIAWYQRHLGIAPTAVVAAHEAVDRGTGLPELRELAVG